MTKPKGTYVYVWAVPSVLDDKKTIVVLAQRAVEIREAVEQARQGKAATC